VSCGAPILNFAVPLFWISMSGPDTCEVERVKGIEPSSSAWKAVALPLSYTRIRDQSSVISDQDR
jgi:hypothetical protein